MKLTEIFDNDGPAHDTETDIQDMIISRFELGQITYDQAWEEIKKQTPDPADLQFWQMELIAAEANAEPEEVRVQNAAQRNIEMQPGIRRTH